MGVEAQGNTVATLISDGGYFGGGIAIEEKTTNIVKNGDFSEGTSNWSISTTNNSTWNNYANVKYEGSTPYLNIHWERLEGSGNAWNTLKNYESTYNISGNPISLSCYVRLNQYNRVGAQIRHSATDNDYWTSGRKGWDISTNGKIGEWVKVDMVRTFESSYTNNDGSIVPLSARFELYSDSMSKAGDMIDFDIKLIQIESKPFSTSFVNGERKAGYLKYPREIINTDEGTISFWIKPTGETTQPCPVFSSGIDPCFDFLIKSPTEKPYLRGYATSSSSIQLRPSIIPFGSWTHIAITWKKSSFLGIYIDGKLDASSNSPMDWGKYYIEKSTGFFIGSGIRNNPNMVIDELRIDKVMRTDEEISQWYVSSVPFYPKGIYRLAY